MIPPSNPTTAPTRFANKFPPLPPLPSFGKGEQMAFERWWNDVQLVLTGQFNQVAVKIDSKSDKP